MMHKVRPLQKIQASTL